MLGDFCQPLQYHDTVVGMFRVRMGNGVLVRQWHHASLRKQMRESAVHVGFVPQRCMHRTVVALFLGS